MAIHLEKHHDDPAQGTSITPRDRSALYAQMKSCADDPRLLIANSLRHSNESGSFLRELFFAPHSELEHLTFHISAELEKVCLERPHDLASALEISSQYVHSQRLMPLGTYRSTYVEASGLDSANPGPIEEKYFVFLNPRVYELLERSPQWHSSSRERSRSPQAPSYRPFNREAASLSGQLVQRSTPVCLPSDISLAGPPSELSAAGLAIVLAPVARAYLMAQPKKQLDPLGYLCFFEQLFGSRASRDAGKSPIIAPEHILPMTCLAWCVNNKPSVSSVTTSGESNRAGSRPSFDPRRFDAPRRADSADQMNDFLRRLTETGSRFDSTFAADTVVDQFARLSTSSEFRSDSTLIELVRALCPLALPTKKDLQSCRIKPLCYLEERQPDGTTPEQGIRYLQGHIVWTRIQSRGDEALFMVRFHTLHRNDHAIKHPTMRVYRIIPNPDPLSPLGSWQYLINGHYEEFRSIQNIERHIVSDQSGNEWISGSYVDGYHGVPFMANHEKIYPRDALLRATHFSFVRESWLK